MSPPRQSDDRVLVLLYPGSILHEVLLAVDLLAGTLTIEFATPTDEPHRDATGLGILPDLTYAAVDPSRYRAVLVPGGDPAQIMEDAQVDRILTDAAEAGAVVAGICAGVLVLAKAGLLRARRIVHNYRAPWTGPEIESFVAAHWEGADVDPDPATLLAQDANVITALPNGHIDFALAVSQALDVHSPEQAAFLAAYHRGQAGPQDAPG